MKLFDVILKKNICSALLSIMGSSDSVRWCCNGRGKSLLSKNQMWSFCLNHFTAEAILHSEMIWWWSKCSFFLANINFHLVM